MKSATRNNYIYLFFITFSCFLNLIEGQSPTPSPTATCQDGYYLLGGGGGCSECPTGRFSNENYTECKVCAPGYYANDVGQSICVKCDIGKLANSDRTAW